MVSYMDSTWASSLRARRPCGICPPNTFRDQMLNLKKEMKALKQERENHLTIEQESQKTVEYLSSEIMVLKSALSTLVDVVIDEIDKVKRDHHQYRQDCDERVSKLCKAAKVMRGDIVQAFESMKTNRISIEQLTKAMSQLTKDEHAERKELRQELDLLRGEVGDLKLGMKGLHIRGEWRRQNSPSNGSPSSFASPTNYFSQHPHKNSYTPPANRQYEQDVHSLQNDVTQLTRGMDELRAQLRSVQDRNSFSNYPATSVYSSTHSHNGADTEVVALRELIKSHQSATDTALQALSAETARALGEARACRDEGDRHVEIMQEKLRRCVENVEMEYSQRLAQYQQQSDSLVDSQAQAVKHVHHTPDMLGQQLADIVAEASRQKNVLEGLKEQLIVVSSRTDGLMEDFMVSERRRDGLHADLSSFQNSLTQNQQQLSNFDKVVRALISDSRTLASTLDGLKADVDHTVAQNKYMQGQHQILEQKLTQQSMDIRTALVELQRDVTRYSAAHRASFLADD